MALAGVWPSLSSTVLGVFGTKVGIILTFRFCTLIFCFYMTHYIASPVCWLPKSRTSQSRTDRVSMSVHFHPSEKLSCCGYKQRSNHLLQWASTKQPQTARGGYICADIIRNPESRLFLPELWTVPYLQSDHYQSWTCIQHRTLPKYVRGLVLFYLASDGEKKSNKFYL